MEPYIVDRKPLKRAQAERAVDRTIATRGEIEVSKCPLLWWQVFFRDELGFSIEWPPADTAPGPTRMQRLFRRHK